MTSLKTRFIIIMVTCLSVLLSIGASTAPPNPCTAAACVPVFYPGLNGSKCYRIPSIIATARGTLLAFAESWLSGCGDQGAHNLVVRRSSDEGRTWGPLIVAVFGTVPCPGCPAAVSNPNPVEVTHRNGSKAIMLAYDTMNNPNAAHHGLDMLTWSFDDGLTWGDAGSAASHAATTLVYPPEPNVGALIGPAVGLEASDGTLFLWITSGFLAISRDHGATWSASQRAPEPSSECSIAFAQSSANATLIMNCRSGKDHRRAQLYWRPTANGSYAASELTYPAQLTDPGCQGSILNANGTLYTSNAASMSARERMTIHQSTDHGASWGAAGGQVLHAGPSAYSQLVQLPSGGGLAVLFEAGTKTAYDTISFAPFTWTPPAPPAPRLSQRWAHQADGTLTTDAGKHCLDWSVENDGAYVAACDPKENPHQIWIFTAKSASHLKSHGAGSDVLDWTSAVSVDGGHRVYVHNASTTLPHQLWTLAGATITSKGGDGLCLDSMILAHDAAEVRETVTHQAVEMHSCA